MVEEQTNKKKKKKKKKKDEQIFRPHSKSFPIHQYFLNPSQYDVALFEIKCSSEMFQSSF